MSTSGPHLTRPNARRRATADGVTTASNGPGVGIAAVVAAAVVAGVWHSTAVGLGLLAGGLLAHAAADHDRRTRRLPNSLVAAVGLVAALTAGTTGSPGAAAMSAVAAGVPFLAIHVAAPAALGLGDAKLAAALGGLTGTISISAGVWLALAVVIVAGRNRWRGDDSLALGPVLLAAALCVAVVLTIAAHVGLEELVA